MRRNGVLELEEDGFKIRLDPGFISSPTKKTKTSPSTDPELLKTDPSAQMPGDGDLLFWSTGTFDDLVEGRKKPAVNEGTN